MSGERVVTLPFPFPHQQEILDDDHRFKVCCWGRQSGKTLMGGIMALAGHGPLGSDGFPLFCGALHGGTIWWVSRDFPTATRIWRDLKSYLRKWGGELEKSEQERAFHFPGGGSLTIKSASDPDSLRGATLDGLVGDEVAFWHQDALSLSLRPALAVKQGWFVLISTPNGLNFFHDEFRKGLDKTDPHYLSWHMSSSSNPALTHDELDRMRHSLGLYGFQRECLAQFEVREGGLFRRDWFTFFHYDGDWIIPDKGERVHKDSLYIFMSADLAMTKKSYSDFTATCVWGRAPDRRMFLLNVTRGKYEAPEVVPMLARLMDRWESDLIWLESSGALVHLNKEAERAMPGRVREYKTHAEKKDKVERAGPAAAAVESARVSLLRGAPWANDLITELCAFPDPHVKDDQVDAFALGVLCAPPANPPRQAKNTPRPRSEDEEPGGERPRWLIGR